MVLLPRPNGLGTAAMGPAAVALGARIARAARTTTRRAPARASIARDERSRGSRQAPNDLAWSAELDDTGRSWHRPRARRSRRAANRRCMPSRFPISGASRNVATSWLSGVNANSADSKCTCGAVSTPSRPSGRRLSSLLGEGGRIGGAVTCAGGPGRACRADPPRGWRGASEERIDRPARRCAWRTRSTRARVPLRRRHGTTFRRPGNHECDTIGEKPSMALTTSEIVCTLEANAPVHFSNRSAAPA